MSNLTPKEIEAIKQVKEVVKVSNETVKK